MARIMLPSYLPVSIASKKREPKKWHEKTKKKHAFALRNVDISRARCTSLAREKKWRERAREKTDIPLYRRERERIAHRIAGARRSRIHKADFLCRQRMSWEKRSRKLAEPVNDEDWPWFWPATRRWSPCREYILSRVKRGGRKSERWGR